MTFQELMDCYHISDTDNNCFTYQQLLEAFKMNQVTPVIGAGLSHWAYPLWTQLLIEQATHYGIEADVKQLLQNNQYEEAASLLEEECTHKDLIRNLSYIFRPQLIEEKHEDCPAYLNFIPRLFCGPIVTTNFDRVIEYLFETAQISRPDSVTPLDAFQSKRIEYALQNNAPILVKMHGDIKDPEHLVLTKQSYDDTYGSNPEEPDFGKSMPTFLKKILERNPLLFLGCSLGADRTCAVIKNCAENCRQFAFLELPKETQNKSDPIHPTLREPDGRLLQKLRDRRRDIIENLNVEPIWYPYGMHSEAYSAFFTKLAEDLNIAPSTRPAIDINYVPLHRLLGREEIICDIIRKFSEKENFCVWVEGTGGIGKTEICKAVYATLKKEVPALDMPYIDISGVTSLLGFFDAVAAGTGIAISGQTGMENIPDELLWRLDERYPLSAAHDFTRILYFDNWEDIWYGLDGREEKDQLIVWMRKLTAGQFRLLVSSRVCAPPALGAYEVHVKPLDFEKQQVISMPRNDFERLDSVKLFRSILNRDVVEEEWAAFQTLIDQFEGHPLTIVLAATQARREVNLNDLLVRWDKARQDTAGMNEKHSSMETALQVSWDVIRKTPSAVQQWGLHFYSLKAIPLAVLNALRGEISDEQWQEGRIVLTDANLVYVTKDRQAIAMLLPLKKQFEILTAANKKIKEDCLIRWAKYIENLLDSANQFSSLDYSTYHQQTVDYAPQIFYIMEQLMTYGTSVTRQHLNNIVLKVSNYYKFYIQSVTLLEKLTTYYKEYDSSRIYANVLKDYGDLLRRLGDVDGAKAAYDNAELIYRQERNNLGLANVLKSRGDLFRRLGDMDGAKAAYDSAELIYRQERNNLGLANVLRSRGDLLRWLGDMDGAKAAYDGAEPLYRQECSYLGLANVLRSRGDLLRRLGDVDGAKAAYNSAEMLYRQERNNLGLANALQSRGDLLRQMGDVDGAKAAYDSAEPLYRQERNNLGLANVLKSRGDLLRRLGDVDGAKAAYDSAEPLYRQERNNLGLANVLKSRGDLQRIYGQLKLAYEDYIAAEKICREINDTMRLIYVLSEVYECCISLNRQNEADSIKNEIHKILKLDNISINAKKYVTEKINIQNISD